MKNYEIIGKCTDMKAFNRLRIRTWAITILVLVLGAFGIQTISDGFMYQYGLLAGIGIFIGLAIPLIILCLAIMMHGINLAEMLDDEEWEQLTIRYDDPID